LWHFENGEEPLTGTLSSMAERAANWTANCCLYQISVGHTVLIALWFNFALVWQFQWVWKPNNYWKMKIDSSTLLELYVVIFSETSAVSPVTA
jgi:hypothetical protein